MLVAVAVGDPKRRGCTWKQERRFHLLIAPEQQRACVCLVFIVTLFPHLAQSNRDTAPPATTTGAVTFTDRRFSRIRSFCNFTAVLIWDTYVRPYGTRISWPATMVRVAQRRMLWLRLLHMYLALFAPLDAAVLAKIPKAPTACSITKIWDCDHWYFSACCATLGFWLSISDPATVVIVSPFLKAEAANNPRPRVPMRTCSLPTPSVVRYTIAPVHLLHFRFDKCCADVTVAGCNMKWYRQKQVQRL